MAEEMAALLRKYSLEPTISEAPVRGKTFYRVRIGPYATVADAKEIIAFVKEPPLGFFDSFVP
jgi:cell division protein FtsN